MISKNQKEKIVRTGSSGGVDVSQTKKAPAVTTMHSNTRTHAVMWTGFGDKIKNACGQAVSGIRKRKGKHPRQICRFFCNNKMKECASDWLDPVTKQKSTCGHEDVCSTHTIITPHATVGTGCVPAAADISAESMIVSGFFFRSDVRMKRKSRECLCLIIPICLRFRRSAC